MQNKQTTKEVVFAEKFFKKLKPYLLIPLIVVLCNLQIGMLYASAPDYKEPQSAKLNNTSENNKAENKASEKTSTQTPYPQIPYPSTTNDAASIYSKRSLNENINTNLSNENSINNINNQNLLRIDPPSNVRAFLLSPKIDNSENQIPRLRILWNHSRDKFVEKYNIVISTNNNIIETATVDKTVQLWESSPIMPQYPPPIIQVRSVVSGKESPPAQTVMPLTIKNPALSGGLIYEQHKFLPAATINVIYEDSDTRNVWLGTEGGGLIQLDPLSGSMKWFTELDGLSGNHIYSIYAKKNEKENSLWIGTDSGITRFQKLGTSINNINDLQKQPNNINQNNNINQVIINNPSNNAKNNYGKLNIEAYTFQDLVKDFPSGPHILGSIIEDSYGKLWISTLSHGLIQFDPKNKESKYISKAEGFPSDNIISLLEESKGRQIWMGTQEGLVLERIQLGNRIMHPKINLPVRAMAQDEDPSIVWVSTIDRIYCWNIENGNAVIAYRFLPGELTTANALVVGKNDDIWVGTNVGLRHFSKSISSKLFSKNASIENIQLIPVPLLKGLSNPSVNLSTLSVNALANGSEGSLWVGLSDGLGLVQYFPVTGQMKHFIEGEVPLELKVQSLLKDNEKNLWIGTERGPVLLTDKNRFILLAKNSNTDNPEFMQQSSILSMAQDEEGLVWLAQSNGELTIYNTRERHFRQYFTRHNRPDTISAITTLAIQASSLYLGTDNSGVRVYGPSTGEAYLDYNLSSSKGVLPSNGILSLLLFQNNLWVGTEAGLVKANVGNGLYHNRAALLDPSWPPPDLPEGLRTSPIRSMAYDSFKQIWIATSKGIWRYNPTSGRREQSWQQFLPSNVDGLIAVIATDITNHLWIGTNRGLYRTDVFSADDELPQSLIKVISDEDIKSLLMDDDNRVWVGTLRGLMLVPNFLMSETSKGSDAIVIVLLITVLVLGTLSAWWFRTYRHPVVVTVNDAPDMLAMFRLTELPMAVTALRRAHRLQAALIFLGLDYQRWQRILETSQLWPTSSIPVSVDSMNTIVNNFMSAIGAEVIPFSEIKFLPDTPSSDLFNHNSLESFDLNQVDSSMSIVSSNSSVNSSINSSINSGIQQGHGIEKLEGFDEGAPGYQEELKRTNYKQIINNEKLLYQESDIDSPSNLYSGSSKGIGFSTPKASFLKRHIGGLTDSHKPYPYIVRLPDLPIRLTHKEMPLLIVRSPLPEEYPYAPLLSAIQPLDISSRYVLLLNLSSDVNLPNLNPVGTRFIPFLEQHIREILFSPNPRTTFVRHFVRHVKITEVSPYSSKGEVANPLMFVGRRVQLDRITGTDNLNYSIVGARQIGKSSLMGAIKRYYRDRSDRVVHSFTLAHQEDARAFYKRFAILLNKSKVPADSTEFADMMAEHYSNHKFPALFLIDEIDGLLARERSTGYPVLTAMRRLQQESICSFIIAGYWELAKLGNDYHSPLYNMAEVIELGPLQKDEAMDLVITPMERMGLSFAKRNIVTDIINETSGHPHLIQFICNQLLAKMTASHPPVFTEEDWLEIKESDDLKRYVTRNFKSNAGPLDELIVYSTINMSSFTHNQLENELAVFGVNIPLRWREESLSKLKLVGIIKEVDHRFEYSLPLFRKMLLRENIQYFATARAKEIKEGLLRG